MVLMENTSQSKKNIKQQPAISSNTRYHGFANQLP